MDKLSKRILIFAAIFAVGFSLVTTFAACSASRARGDEVSRAARSAEDGAAALTTTPDTRPVKPYTVMIYMNGSDLESEYGAATADLAEMSNSGFSERYANLVVYTGGAAKWRTRVIPNDKNAVFVVRPGTLKSVPNLAKVTEFPQTAMGDPDTLGGFLSYAVANFPAENYVLIMWNHGGGSIVGYGYDENYAGDLDMAAMKLSGLEEALKGLGGTKLRLIGFDTCLMSSLETAEIVSASADFMVASEEVEPEDGWDYSFLKAIKPSSNGEDIGRAIIDRFEAYYKDDEYSDFNTLSLTDLSKAERVSAAFESLAKQTSNALNAGAFNVISRARARSRAFGSGGEDGETDMIDLGLLAENMFRMFPEACEGLLDALGDAVVHRNDSAENLGGLSVYFPFANKENLDQNMAVYASIGRLPEYTAFLNDFAKLLSSRPRGSYRDFLVGDDGVGDGAVRLSPQAIQSVADITGSLWLDIDGDPNGAAWQIQLSEGGRVDIADDGEALIAPAALITLNGRPACLYDTHAANGSLRRYAIPIKLNGHDANLIAVIDEEGSEEGGWQGRILGAIPTNGGVMNMLDKKLMRIKPGDTLAIRYYAIAKEGTGATEDDKKAETWLVGESFRVEDGLTLEKAPTYNEKAVTSKLKITDTRNNSYYFN